MRLLNFLSGIAPVLVCLAPPTDGGGGGAIDPKPAEPTGDTPEAKYTSALHIIEDYFKQLSGAMSEKDAAVSQVAGLNDQIKSLTSEKEKLTSDLESLTSKVDGLNSQIVGLTKERDDARSKTTLISEFCKAHNLDLAGLERFKALKEVPEASGAKDGKALYDQWQALKNAGEGKKATAFFRKHKAELAEYAESTR